MSVAGSRNTCGFAVLVLMVETLYTFRPALIRPLPMHNFGFVNTVLIGIAAAFDLLISEVLLRMRARRFQARNSVNHVHGDAETVDLILNSQFQRGVDIASFLVAANVQIVMIRPPVCQAVNEPRIGMEVKDDWLVHGKQ